MNCEINLRLPEGWKSECKTEIDEYGTETKHFEAHLPGNPGEPDDTLIDIFLGDMPEDETAEDQAFANYAEAIGFDDDDDDSEESPIIKFRFRGKAAYGFEAETEDGFPMRFFAQEVKKGLLMVVAYYVKSDDLLLPTFELLERNLKVNLV